ncbi:IPTL-CTERM sorting domain-containing protein [Ottowia thiooxydans]|uniref:Alpha-tubulin suppressor-like RCC1 family protein n=1 Tax=Ottowia thiooxydans TaxID=219182 RepID=A0ABV2Q475_9BURK
MSLISPIQTARISQSAAFMRMQTCFWWMATWLIGLFMQSAALAQTPPGVALPASLLGEGVQQVVSGTGHTCALTTAGAVKCWGWNVSGQLGNNSTTNSPVPVDVSGLSSGVFSVATGDSHTCAVTTGGAAKCWGWNALGQLGNNTTITSLTPVDVSGLVGVSALGARASHNCALTMTGAVKCWGSNAEGELGDNTSTSRHTPVDVIGLTSGVTSLAVGSFHNCAVTSGGAVKCWGLNNFGQMGNDSTAHSLTPGDVHGLGSGAAVVAAGNMHTCALTTAGGLKCWGSNEFGKLGNVNNTQFYIPVSVFVGQQLSFAPGYSGTPLNTWPVSSSMPLSAISSSPGYAPIYFGVWTPDTCSVVSNTLVPNPTAPAGSLCGVRAWRVGHDDGANGTTAAAPAQSRLLLLTGPASPTLGTLTPGDEQITVNWSPSPHAGVVITGYTATAYTTGSPPQAAGTCTTSATPPDLPATSCVITGLTNGTLYNITVETNTAIGVAGSVSGSTPIAPILSVSLSSNLPGGQVGQSYDASVAPIGGTAPYHFSITSGSLPTGLSAAMASDGNSILITGTPSQAQTATFTLSVSDSTVPEPGLMSKAGPTVTTVEQQYTITIAAAPPPALVGITPVPTMGQWGLLLMSVLLAAITTLGRRYRKL